MKEWEEIEGLSERVSGKEVRARTFRCLEVEQSGHSITGSSSTSTTTTIKDYMLRPD